MKKLPAIILLLLITVSTLMQSCGESDCPLTTNSFAHFDFLDAETHQAVKFSPAFDVTGFITTDVIVRDTLEDGTIKETVVKDSLMNDTIFNKAESSMSLPLSYTSKTTYVLHYTEKMRDTITLIHQNIPYLQNIECGTMMFYKVEDIKYTTYNLKSMLSSRGWWRSSSLSTGKSGCWHSPTVGRHFLNRLARLPRLSSTVPSTPITTRRFFMVYPKR